MMHASKRTKRRVAQIIFLNFSIEISDRQATIEQVRATIEREAKDENVVLPEHYKLFTNGQEVTPFVWGQFQDGTLGDKIICRIPSSAASVATGDTVTYAPQSMPAPPFVKNAESAMREKRMAYVKNQMGIRFRECTVDITIPQPSGTGDVEREAASSRVLGNVAWTWPSSTDDVEAGRHKADLPAHSDASAMLRGPVLTRSWFGGCRPTLW